MYCDLRLAKLKLTVVDEISNYLQHQPEKDIAIILKYCTFWVVSLIRLRGGLIILDSPEYLRHTRLM